MSPRIRMRLRSSVSPSALVFVATLTAVPVLASSAAAQTPAQRPDPLLAPPKESAPKWTFELRGGFGAATTPSKGSRQLPGAGLNIQGTQGVPVPRSATSFFFGDGATQWNGVFPNAAMQPIDDILTSPIVRRDNGSAFGLSIGRSLTTRWSLDVNLDMALQPLALTSSAQTGLQQAVSAFAQAFPPLGGSAQGALGGTTRAGREFSITAGASYWLTPRGRFRTFLSAGGGTLVDAKGPSPTLTGLSQLSVVFSNGTANFSSTDHVALHANDGHVRPTVYVGGGFERSLTASTGLRCLVRAGLASTQLTTTVDASPAYSRTGAIDVLVLSSQTDTIVFSTSPAVAGTLSATSLKGFQTFKGSGLRVQALVSAGYFFRF